MLQAHIHSIDPVLQDASAQPNPSGPVVSVGGETGHHMEAVLAALRLGNLDALLPVRKPHYNTQTTSKGCRKLAQRGHYIEVVLAAPRLGNLDVLLSVRKSQYST